MTDFDVQLGKIRYAGASLDGAGQRLTSLLDSFESQLEGYGAPWGTDDIGSLIGIAYTETAAYTFECLEIAADEISSAGNALSDMADSYERTDEAIVGALRELARGLGS